ncbi:DsrE family protein [Acidihalobacter ferrooxydans]|uniref:Peroxiredoxin n=1 Tax=Acidihalobacter ferrooxydans TaxID=1765967 RepID=A0A1P8UIQ2_9GAMM|nr:DsrE family protein [Acidihalobacter ferrooxydans]APZ43684.1 peroxiredoxin [Acidihalobacter ferrooxydans]
MSEEAPDLVIILITGKENPKRLPSAFFMASTAAAMEQSVVMYFTGPATELLKAGEAEKVFPLEGGKSVAQFMDLALENGVRIIGCQQSLDLNGMTKDDLGMELPLLTPSMAMPTLGAAGRVLTW